MTQYKLLAPFEISPRLCIGMRLGDAWLSLLGTFQGPRESVPVARTRVGFVIDFADGTSYEDDSMSSGYGGFQGVVCIFETFLSFLMAAVESYEFEQRNPGRKGENTDLFPLHVVKWASENPYHDEWAMDMYVENDYGNVNESLIEVV